MATVTNFLQRRVFMLNHWRVHLLSGRKFSTKIQEELTCRLATSSDFDNVVKLSTGIFNGYDCIPVVFHEWLKKENMAIMLLFAGRSLIGLSASCIVDEGKTFVRRFDRIIPNLRGQGLQRKIADALDEHVRTNFPNVSRERATSFLDLSKVVSRKTPYQILERDELSFFVQEKPTGNVDRYCNFRRVLDKEKESDIESCTKEYFCNVILSSSVKEKMIPNNNVLVFDWCPYEPLPSNVDLIPGEKHHLHFFVDKCSSSGGPISFSYGIHTQTVMAEKWEATVYTDDPAVFEAHLLHQFKLARDIIEGKFTFFSVQDRIMTPFARRVLWKILQLKEANFLNGATMKVFERPFISR